MKTMDLSELPLSVLVGLVVLCQGVFLLMKGLAWQKAYNAAGVECSLFKSIRIFCIATLLELLTFMPFIGGDLYRLWLLKEFGKKSVAVSIALARIPSVILLACCGSFTLLQGEIPVEVFLGSVFFAGLFYFWKRRRVDKVRESGFASIRDIRLGSLFPIGLFQLLSFVTDYLRFLLIAVTLKIVHEVSFVDYCGSIFVGAISLLPLGLGMKDISLMSLLPPSLSTEAFAKLILFMRLSGEGIAFLLALFFLLKGGRKSLSKFRKARNTTS